MEAYKTALPIIFVAVLIGLSSGLLLNQPSLNLDIQSAIDSISDAEAEQSGNEIGRVGSAHEHALFHVVINGSEKDFTDQKFQANSRYVHLENNKSDVVHKHATGITWEVFFRTINLSTSTGKTDLCLEIYGNRSCGKGSFILNGEVNASVDQEISQGDNMLIILNTREWKDVFKEYMQKQLPEHYQPKKRRGGSI